LDEKSIKRDLENNFANPMNHIIEVNKPFQYEINTSENQLYRKLLKKALNETNENITVFDD